MNSEQASVAHENCGNSQVMQEEYSEHLPKMSTDQSGEIASNYSDHRPIHSRTYNVFHGILGSPINMGISICAAKCVVVSHLGQKTSTLQHGSLAPGRLVTFPTQEDSRVHIWRHEHMKL